MVKIRRTLRTDGFGRELDRRGRRSLQDSKKTIEHRSFEPIDEPKNNKIHVKPVGTGVLDGPKNQTNFHNQSANRNGIVSRKIHRGSFVNDLYKTQSFVGAIHESPAINKQNSVNNRRTENNKI